MPDSETISITLPSETLRVVRQSVEAGEYASSNEAMRDAVRVWQEQRLDDAERLSAIRARVRRSLDDPRPDLTLDEIDARLAKLHAEFAEAGGDAET